MRAHVQALHQKLPIPSFPAAGWSGAAEQRTREWVRRMGLVRSAAAVAHFAAIGAGGLAGRVYPDAVPGRRDVVTDWLSWLFVFDDQCDEGTVGRDPVWMEGVAKEIGASLEDGGFGGHSSDPRVSAMADLWARLRSLAPDEWAARFRLHVLHYLRGCQWEAANRATFRVPHPAEYPTARRAAGAIIPSLDLIEFATATYLPERVRRLPRYQDAVEAAADVVCWTDDLATVAKERARDDVHNLVIVLAHHCEYSWAEAATEARRLLDDRIADFLTAERALLEGTSCAQVTPNLRGLRQWIRGHLDWGIHTARYRDVERATGVPGYIEDLPPPGTGTEDRMA